MQQLLEASEEDAKGAAALTAAVEGLAVDELAAVVAGAGGVGGRVGGAVALAQHLVPAERGQRSAAASSAALRTAGSIAHQTGVEHRDLGVLGLLREERLALLVGAGLGASHSTEQSDVAQHPEYPLAKNDAAGSPKQRKRATGGSRSLPHLQFID